MAFGANNLATACLLLLLAVVAALVLAGVNPGPTGSKGDQGPQGDQGEQGPQGTQGPQGVISPTQLENLSLIERYMDSVPLGTSATANAIKVGNGLTSIRAWFALPISGPTTTILLRFYRYRRVGGVFSYTQLNDTVTLNSTFAWSTWHDFSSTIRLVDLDPSTDTIAISTVYTVPGGESNSIRALLATCETGDVGITPLTPGVPAAQQWPPPP